MSAGSFASPRYEPRLSATSSLHAIAGFNDDPLPLDIHVHPEIEVGIVLTGEEWILFGGMAMACAPGDVWMCAMWEPHGWEIRPPHTRNVVLKFMPEFLGGASGGDMSWLAPFLAPATYRPRVASAAVRRKVLALGRWLRREVEERGSAWEQVVRVELLHLLIVLGRDWETAGLSPPTRRVRLNALARLMPALSLAHSYPWRRVNVREAAGACGLSPSQFQNLFRDAMGASFGRVLPADPACRRRPPGTAHPAADDRHRGGDRLRGRQSPAPLLREALRVHAGAVPGTHANGGGAAGHAVNRSASPPTNSRGPPVDHQRTSEGLLQRQGLL